ncbi:MAG: alkaline phosphatase PhoX [Gammaproteobacteria bacterium]
MTSFKKRTLAVAVALAAAPAAFAGTAPYFIPLTQDAHTVAPNAAPEQESPWFVPAGMTQELVTSMREIEADASQSVQRVPAGQNSSMWDMTALDPSGNYMFIPHETPIGAGVTRYDIANDKATLIFAGDQQGAGPDGARATADDMWDHDFGAFDPSRYTPNGTVIAAEEWSGLGRVVEIMDPFASPADPVAGSPSMVEGTDWRVLPIANVSHEGINFSLKHPDQIIYFIDEHRSGSIYKMVLKTPGDYAAGGQTFALKAANYLGDVTINWNSGNNGTPAVLASRFGLGSWEPLTDADGNPLPGINPIIGATTLNCAAGDAADQCRDGDIRPGRVAADDAGGTPFGRPEDTGVQILPNGNEILYIATTSEDSVISIEETAAGPMVRLFASENGPDGSGVGTPKNVGFLPTSGRLNAPDNIAIDSLGNVYIVEDGPNNGNAQGIGSNGDVWFARDMDNDGVAESLDHFMSLQVSGAENTGMLFNPNNPTEFWLTSMHPRSVDLANFPDGIGDALWKFDIANIAPPACEGPRSNWMTFDKASRRWVRACSNTRDFNLPERMDANTGSVEFPVQ